MQPRLAVLLGRRAAALLALASAACRPGEPLLPPRAERVAPPSVYARWWGLVEECASVTRPLSTVAWYVVPDVPDVRVGRQRVLAYWAPSRDAVVVAGNVRYDGGGVRAAMLQALLRRTDHPRAAFLDRCGGVVTCADDCVRDAGPPPAPDPAMPRVSPAALEVTAAVAPVAPSPARDDGLFSYIISVHNPAPHAVIVTLPTRPGRPGIATSYPYFVMGPSASRGGGFLALDSSVTRFAAGQTKRQVFDFSIARGITQPDYGHWQGAWGSAFPPGAYTFTGGFGDHAAPAVRAVLGP